MHTGRLLLRRLLYLIVQLWGVATIAFFLVHLIPGNPAQALAGSGASAQSIHGIERQLGFDKPLPQQYVLYLWNVLHGNLGDSIFTGQTVLHDLEQRIPATVGLVTAAMLISVVIGVPLGIYVGLKRSGILSRIAFVYGMLTGALPDFWLGLVLIFVFFYLLRWAPAPLGQLDAIQSAPPHVTGLSLIDSLLAGDWVLFASALGHLVLPALTLVLVYMGNIVKMARSSMSEAMQSGYVEHARAMGLPNSVVLRYAVRNALAPVVTVIAFTYGFLLGGAVLVETIFSWGGLGQYAVQSITNSDYFAITGFVLAAALFMAVIYLVLDLVYAVLDPRIEY
ncbi:MAG: ABC transporter permease [Candidatus Dormiibacter spiritus]|nr:MAG: ABC transporter permease [Candidatus Dormibacteraeota bacterium]